MSNKNNKDLAKQTQVYTFLNSQISGVLSTIDENGGPASAVIYYFIDNDFNICFITKTNTEKYRNISKNNKVSLCVYDEKGRHTVEVKGEAKQSEDSDQTIAILDKLATVRHFGQESWVPPAAQLHDGKFVAMIIKVNYIKFADFKKYNKDDGSDVIEQIDLTD